MKPKKRSRLLPLLLCLLAGLVLIGRPQTVLARSNADDQNLPNRLVSLALEYPGIVVPLGENISMDVIISNKGKSDEDVDIWPEELPLGWTAKIKTYRFQVTSVHVPSGDNKSMTLELTPPKGVKPGLYSFRVAAKTPDEKFRMSKTLKIEIKEKSIGQQEAKGVKINTSYPVLRGATDGTFEFSLEVESKLDKDAIFNLLAQGPEGWEINFKPAYESKYISSLRLKADQSQSVAVEVKPAPMAPTGEYPIQVKAGAGDAQAEAELTVDLTGTYKLEAGTPSGLLSLDARQGQPANLSIYVKNTGSAVNNGIKFMSFKPENWKVTFNPEQIDTLKPGDLKQVEVTITPYEEALVGDYSVNIRVDGEKATQDVEFRVTVKASSAWGWIGIAIIVGVVAGLIGLFRWLGRR